MFLCINQIREVLLMFLSERSVSWEAQLLPQVWSFLSEEMSAERCGCASSAPQTDMEDGRNPSIKKSLFPLFSSKNSLKHNSAVKVLPVVASPLVQHQPAAPYPASPVIPPLQLHVDLHPAAFRSSQTSDAWLDFTCFLFMGWSCASVCLAVMNASCRRSNVSRLSRLHHISH